MTLLTVISKSLYSTKCNNVDFSLINDFLKIFNKFIDQSNLLDIFLIRFLDNI